MTQEAVNSPTPDRNRDVSQAPAVRLFIVKRTDQIVWVEIEMIHGKLDVFVRMITEASDLEGVVRYDRDEGVLQWNRSNKYRVLMWLLEHGYKLEVPAARGRRNHG